MLAAEEQHLRDLAELAEERELGQHHVVGRREGVLQPRLLERGAADKPEDGIAEAQFRAERP